jgi:hypothetical protein
MIQDITDEAAGTFCEDFEAVERKIIKVDDLMYDEEEEEEVGLREMFPRTSGEIRVLLS